MKIERRIPGLERIRTNTTSCRKGMWTNFDIYNRREVSEDTKIRRNIYDIINAMAKEEKSCIEIKIALTEKYPSYEEYIIKMINQYFNKLNAASNRKKSNISRGDER